MKTAEILLGSAIAIFIAQVAVLLTNASPLIDITYILLAGIAAYSMYRTASHETEVEKKVLLLLATGMGLWCLGEFSWAFYEIILAVEVPFPSIADLFWTAGYIPLVLAFYYHRRELFIAEKLNVAGYLVGLTLLVWSSWVVYLNILHSTGLELIINVFYIGCSFYIMYEYAFSFSQSVIDAGDFLRPWLILGRGFFGFAIYNVAFAQLTATDTFWTGHPIDILYGLSYILVVIAAYSRLKSKEETARIAKR